VDRLFALVVEPRVAPARTASSALWGRPSSRQRLVCAAQTYSPFQWLAMMHFMSSISRFLSELAVLRTVPTFSNTAAKRGEWIQILYGMSTCPRPAVRSASTFFCSALSSLSGISLMRLGSAMRCL
jgi:hypothetical protein